MKSVLDLSRVAGLSIAILLAGCGQKGPLYLPAKPPAATPMTTPAPQQAPAQPAAPASR
ncbi:LPS translocon maturation chaperone LptM [Noviherbaspirillum sp.]|uniref:LPS translocon maturation chaperone LptM n=1 Tax=Noviherbaspirillum sp. TaxID=1926288 RepID=UPI002D6172DB|nr:lipoprotein [Noviherbaspirillum sp.]HZW21881.1 lipoprotein [Noviherbaspirillum sp.]